jgi:hypothetical protein
MFLRAGTAEELVRSQVNVNVLVMGRAEFTDIQFVEGQWYAWFLLDIDAVSPNVLQTLMPEIVINGDTQ